MKKALLVFSLSGILFSCSKDADQIKELEAEVMSIHDEVMPQMDVIMSLRKDISKKIQHLDSLENEGITGNNLAEEKMRAADADHKLSEADKIMMRWMNEFKADSIHKLSASQQLIYFEAEKNKIEEVKIVTQKSINDVKSFLNKQ